MFRTEHPEAWSFHQYTSRFPHNIHGLNPPTYEIAPFKEDFTSITVELPQPQPGSVPFGECICSRQSCRSFTGGGITTQDLSNILFAGYGITGKAELQGEFLERPVPSGGGLYPLELYIIVQTMNGLESGIYHYVPLGHFLETIQEVKLPTLLTSELYLGQPYLTTASIIIVMTAIVERSMWKYEDRGYRYILFEAGHVAQNLNLAATSLELGSLNLGGFFDEDVKKLLKLDGEFEIPLYSVAIGLPGTGNRAELRQPPIKDAKFRRY